MSITTVEAARTLKIATERSPVVVANRGAARTATQGIGKQAMGGALNREAATNYKRGVLADSHASKLIGK